MEPARFVGPGVARAALFKASERQVKEWLKEGARGPPPTEYTTAAMAAAASSRRGGGADYVPPRRCESKAERRQRLEERAAQE